MIVAGMFAVAALLASAWGCYWKSRYHHAKAEVYREFADTFAGATHYRKPKEERRAESKRFHMQLALIDPLVRDGLWDALKDADEHWGRLSFDSPRTPVFEEEP